MTDDDWTDETTAALEGVVPILSVSDLEASLAYYTTVLGFDVAWQWGEPPYLASVFRDRVELNLSQAETAAAPAASRVYFQVSNVDDYYDQVTSAGAKVDVALDARPYGMKDFRIVDPSGNELSFGEAIEARQESAD
jgi:catechol 2,3-dioxygenase-like lactoylglutathione lyase family enzyme